MLKFVLTAVYLCLLVALLYQPISIPENSSRLFEEQKIEKALKEPEQEAAQKLADRTSKTFNDSSTSQTIIPVRQRPFQVRAKLVSR